MRGTSRVQGDLREDEQRVFQGRCKDASREQDVLAVEQAKTDRVWRVTKMVSKGLLLVMLMVGVVSAEVVICTQKECMTEFGRRLTCFGVNAGEKTLFIQTFRGGDGRFYGYRQIALSNLFLSDGDDDGEGGNSGAILGTQPPSATIPDLSREVDRQQQQQQRAQAFSFPGFGGPICVLDDVPSVLGTGGVVTFGNPFGLCCRACRR
ncbi:hypothetical protein FGB62_93g033 [Gracilaria domingensis]|nr:hypothetical protein FGB62_93g033 [Gracilaria domingensis]